MPVLTPPRYTVTEKAIADRFRKKHNRIRLLESIAVLLLCVVVVGGAIWYVEANAWDTEGKSLLVSGVMMAFLIVWLGVRKLIGASPILNEEDYILERIDEEIALVRTNI